MAYIIPTFFFTIGENANCIVEKINPSEILSGEITLDDFYGKYAIDDTSNLNSSPKPFSVLCASTSES